MQTHTRVDVQWNEMKCARNIVYKIEWIDECLNMQTILLNLPFVCVCVCATWRNKKQINFVSNENKNARNNSVKEN